MEVEQYVLQLAQLKENKVILHTIIWEQCTKSLCIKLKGTDGYEAAKDTNDCIWLLNKIRSISLNYESTKPKFLSLDDALEQYVTFRQDTKSNDDYFKAFNEVVSVYEHLGGTLTHGTAFEVEMSTRVAKGVMSNLPHYAEDVDEDSDDEEDEDDDDEDEDTDDGIDPQMGRDHRERMIRCGKS